MSAERHVIIGGCGRSGTTLFRQIIDRHPSFACGPESAVLLPASISVAPLAARYKIDEGELRRMLASSRSQAEFVDRFAGRYREMRGKRRWAEKTPQNERHFGWVLDHFPDARLIHIIRDGRDVVCSLAEHVGLRWEDGALVPEFKPRPLETHAKTWLASTGLGTRFRGDPRYHEVRYEDLVAEPEETVRRVTTFVDEPFVSQMLELPGGAAAARTTISPASVGRWQRDLAPDALAKVMSIIGDRLRELGYV